jgi:hypothetical protein
MRVFDLSTQIKFIDWRIYSAIFNSNIQKPRAVVEWINGAGEVFILGDCSSFRINLSKDEILEGFSLTLENAHLWNPRFLDSVLSPDISKRVNIYFGFNIEGVDVYTQIFAGIPEKAPERYSYGDSNSISIKGKSLAFILQNTPGIYPTNFNGASKELIQYWLDNAGIKYRLSYTDNIDFIDRQINYSSVLTAIHTFDLALGPLKDFFFDPSGVFVWRDAPLFRIENADFHYGSEDIVSLSRDVDLTKIITVVDVFGAGEESTIHKEAYQGIIDKYGRRKVTRNNGLINTYWKADKLSDDILEYGSLFGNLITLELLSMNPYLSVGSLVTIEDEVSSTELNPLKIHTVTHSYAQGSECKTEITGYISG